MRDVARVAQRDEKHKGTYANGHCSAAREDPTEAFDFAAGIGCELDGDLVVKFVDLDGSISSPGPCTAELCE